jgi:hypothetical protein
VWTLVFSMVRQITRNMIVGLYGVILNFRCQPDWTKALILDVSVKCFQRSLACKLVE